MKRIIYNIIAIAAIVLFVLNISCTNEADSKIENDTSALSINLSFNKIETRALTTEDGVDNLNENKISSLDVFFYQGSTLKWHITGSEVSYDSNIKKATIPVSANKRLLFEGNTSTTYDIYVVANNTADFSSINEDENNLNTLQNLIFQTPEFVSKGGATAQTSFVMDGKISKTVNLNSPDLGTVDLKRAAAKIRLNVKEVNVPGYSAGSSDISVQLVHFTDKSVLLDDGTTYAPNSSDWKTTQAQEVDASSKTTAAPFYAYANDWTTDNDKETYLELYVPLKENATNIEHTYKYYIPVTPQNLTGDEAQYMNNLQRNLLYDIDVTIKILGSIEEPPVEVSGNYIIKDWTTQEILVDIKGSHYLVVSENNVVMPNINSYTLNFNSSIPNVTLKSGTLKASYTYVNVDTGQEVTVNIPNNQLPTITVASGVASGNITITSSIPVNFIPKDIEFEVTNGQLTEKIVVRQLPPTYYTSEKGVKSNLRNQLASNHNNPYMYQITTLASDGNIVWGFPPVNNNGDTENSDEVANMVSPKFMMASQFGATSTMNYNSGVTNCRNYWEETVINGITVRYDDWRLPTKAEIKYIDDLQHNTNNPQGVVMRGNYYWSARSTGAYKMKAPLSSSGSTNSAHVRCIRDIKD